MNEGGVFMKFDPILFLTIMLIPLTMIGFGFYFFKRGPQTINGFFGYRTSRSMKNQDTWRFAHKHCGRIWMIWGTVLLAASTAAFLYGSLASHPLFSIARTPPFSKKFLLQRKREFSCPVSPITAVSLVYGMNRIIK